MAPWSQTSRPDQGQEPQLLKCPLCGVRSRWWHCHKHDCDTSEDCPVLWVREEGIRPALVRLMGTAADARQFCTCPAGTTDLEGHS